MAPVKQLAAVILETGKQVELRRINIPKPGKGQVLLKIKVACMNPIDRKMAEWAAADGAFQKGKVSGCDVTGIVVDMGPDAGTFVKVGDRVAGFIYGATQTDNGGYAEYCVCRADLCLPIPDHMSDEEGSQLSIPLLTACQVLYQSLGFPMPPQPAAPKRTIILVNGATSTVGAYTIQLAKLAGLTVFATASKEKFAFAKSMGADAVYDYKDVEIVKKVQDGSFGNLKYIVDAISDFGTEKLMADFLSDEGGKIAVVRVLQSPRENVEVIHSLAYDFLVDRTTAPRSYLNDGPYYAALAKKYLAEGKIKTMPWKVIPGGLSVLNDMFKEYADGKIRGEKCVLRISETPQLYQMPNYSDRAYY